MYERVTVEEHPWPPIIMHWVHLLSFFALIVTGLLIHYAPSGIPMQTVRTVHFVSMFIFIATTVVRIYWALVGRSANRGDTKMVRDWRHFGIGASDFKLAGQYIKYYLFLRKTRPMVSKYNPLQKMTYTLLFPLGVLWMALTGFTIWTNTAPYFGWFAGLMGGPDTVRLWHYFGMWIMIVFWMIHFYLVIAEEPAEFMPMFFHSVVGEEGTDSPDEIVNRKGGTEPSAG